MVSGVAYLTAGDQIKTNFGDEPFVFDTAIFEKGVDGFVSEPTFVFQTQEYVDPLEPVIGAPDTRYIG